MPPVKPIFFMMNPQRLGITPITSSANCCLTSLEVHQQEFLDSNTFQFQSRFRNDEVKTPKVGFKK